MKKYLILCFMSGFCLFTNAQYMPNTRWPYLYENFMEGNIYFEGNKKSSARLNIHLWGNALHYITPDEKIFESSDTGVIRVEIDKDTYLYADRKLMKLIAKKEKNVLLKLVTGDFDTMTEGTGAYGASLNSSASTALSSLDLGGMDKPLLGKMLKEKNEGREIPLKTAHYYIIDNQLVEANKKELTNLIGLSKKEDWKEFLKKNNIKWKREESLIKVLNFFVQK